MCACLRVVAVSLLFALAIAGFAEEIPKAAWRRPIGAPLEHPGVTKHAGYIDDGYWQGAPVGGFGAGGDCGRVEG